MKIIFFGSDAFAAEHLKHLLETSHEVCACVTQPDKAKGRGLQVTLSPVKLLAQSRKIPVIQPVNLRDKNFIKALRDAKIDLFVVIAYGRILPADILDIPSEYAINVHGSLLPKYRGAAPINWAIINGEEETGLSIIKLNPTIDAGDILAQERIKITSEDTSVTLKAKMTQLGPPLLLKTITAIQEKQVTMTAQDEASHTLAPKLTKGLGLIQWSTNAKDIHNRVRGLLPWPTAFCFVRGRILKVLESQVTSVDSMKYPPGEVLDVTRDGVIVATKDHGLMLTQVHLEASNPMDARSFALGHQIVTGFKFDSE